MEGCVNCRYHRLSGWPDVQTGSEGGRTDLMCLMMNCSKHFMMIVVCTNGRSSFKQAGADFFGTGTTVVALKQVGTTAWLSEMLKMSVYTSAQFMCIDLTERSLYAGSGPRKQTHSIPSKSSAWCKVAEYSSFIFQRVYIGQYVSEYCWLMWVSQ